MKRLIILIAMLTILGGISAQDHSYTLTQPVSYYGLPYRAMDTVSSKSNDSTWYMQYYLSNYNFPVKVNVKLHAHELTGTGNCAVSLQGKQFDSDAWTNITTVNYSGSGSDTTITITDGTARQFQYYRVFLDKVYGTAGRVGVMTLDFKAWQTQ